MQTWPVGKANILWLVLDSLRFDVAQHTFQAGQTPHFAEHFPGGWEKRHSPGSFTFAAHAAFFAGFLPTPAVPGKHARPIALEFPGSETCTSSTVVLPTDNVVTGFRAIGYHTICVGGVGFFNKRSPLGSVFTTHFHESYWSEETGVTSPTCTEKSVQAALEMLSRVPVGQYKYLFINIAAIHQPNAHYLPGCGTDCLESHAAALVHVDRALAPLWAGLQATSPWHCVVFSDHGTAYGEDGYNGHRLAHSVVWDVPYAEFAIDPTS
ncbi:MAG: STM4013/SEN3800 family hydrolase [Zavarzinella sp.]